MMFAYGYILICSLFLFAQSTLMEALPIPYSLQLSLLKHGFTYGKDALEWTQKLFQKESTISMLEKYCQNITDLAYEGKLDPVIGREEEVQHVIQILSRKTKNNPILIGKPGVGKTAIIEGLAQRIIAVDVPLCLQNKKIFSLNIGALMSGASMRGELEERVTGLLKEIENDSDSIILFIDEIHMLAGIGLSDSGISIVNLLKPAFARGVLHCVGATTITEYKKYIEKDSALERRFQKVFVEEPSPEETLTILRALKKCYEEYHNVIIKDEALEVAIELSVQLIPERSLPDKAIDLLDEASCLVKNNTKISAEVDRNAIATVLSRWTKIPVERISFDESQKLLALEDKLCERVIGQQEAIEKISNTIRIHRVGINDPKKPLGSFLFLGPTGVGKTEVARTLAECLFHDERNIIRIDMSEYSERHSIARLIGSPPGYIGYEDGGQLTEAVRRHPYSIVLFDEIEKAHPDILNIFLQILDEGRLTDSQGSTVSFKNCIIIMTSNIGSRVILASEGDITSEIKTAIEPLLFKHFSPEIFNRIDEIIYFKTLSFKELEQITKIQLMQIFDLPLKKGIMLTITEEAIQQLIKIGYVKEFGVRPLKRAIQRYIVSPLAIKILKCPEEKHFIIDIQDNNFIVG